MWMRVVALLLAAAPLAAQPLPAEQALARLGEALRQHSFSGVLVYYRDGQLDALQVRHARDGAPELIERLTGPALPLRREGGLAQLGQAPVLGFSAAEAGAVARLQPDRHYRAEKVGEDRVAGRAAEVIDLRAADALRFSRRYWVDRDTGLLLRAAVYAGDGAMVEQWMFASLEFGESGLGHVAGAPAEITRRQPGAADIPRTRLQVLDLPAGFALVSAAVEGDEEHLVFSDGLARVSLFAEPLGERAAVLSGHQRRGALSVFGRLYQGLQIVVVGEVPAATAERFAQSIDRADAG